MDWFTIVLILIFFVFPVIQQILEAKKGRSETREDPFEDQPEPLEPLERHGRRAEPELARTKPPKRQPAAEVEWSSDWGSWPGSATKVEETRVTSPEVENRGPILINYEAPPKPVEKTAPRQVPSRPPIAPMPTIEAPRVEIGDVRRAARSRRAKRPAAWDEPLELLTTARDPARLRRIIVLTEVFGKPKSLSE
jgi:hypothetical protein